MTARLGSLPPWLAGPLLVGSTAPPGTPLVRLVTEEDWTSSPLIAGVMQGFRGRVGNIWAEGGDDGIVLHVGLGPAAAAGPEALHGALQASGSCLRGLPALRVSAPSVVTGDGGVSLARSLAVALHRAAPVSLSALALRDDDEPLPLDELLVASGFPILRVHDVGENRLEAHAFASGAIVGAAQALASLLVDLPPNVLNPASFARTAATLAASAGLRCHIASGADLARVGAGGLLAMGAGSRHAPCLVHLSSGPSERRPDLAIVGKGITYDSGGLSLKSAEALVVMKNDMAGAAAALGALLAASVLHPDLRVDVVLALAENMPDAEASRPGDVIMTMSGLTVEILNTDFEGRVVLADALTFASLLSPRCLVDVATLTESAVLALGPDVAALFSADNELASRLEAASKTSGEPVWRMPMDDRYDGQLSSDLADIRNFPENQRFARSITAARFLSRFVPAGTPWAHLDIAGPAWDGRSPGRRGGTGFGVGMLSALLSSM